MARCCKCDSSNVNAKFIQSGALINSSSLRNVNNEFIDSVEYDYFYKLTAKKDHLRFECGYCGYIWRENTKDAK